MSKSIYKAFETDKQKEQDGIELDYGDMGSIFVARAGGANKRFAKALEFRSRPYRRQLDKGTLSDDVANKLLAEVFADTIVLGWKGILDKEGSEVEFTKENCIKLFMELPELFTDIQEQTQKMANFQAEDLEDDSKN